MSCDIVCPRAVRVVNPEIFSDVILQEQSKSDASFFSFNCEHVFDVIHEDDDWSEISQLISKTIENFHPLSIVRNEQKRHLRIIRPFKF